MITTRQELMAKVKELTDGYKQYVSANPIELNQDFECLLYDFLIEEVLPKLNLEMIATIRQNGLCSCNLSKQIGCDSSCKGE